MRQWKPALARPGPQYFRKEACLLRKRFLLMLSALLLCSALAGCAQNASESVELSDVAGHASEAAILEALRRGLCAAPSDGLFRPDEPVTGGEFVAALWNLAGQPDSPDALSWADENGFLDAASFDPDAPVTRQEAMNILYAYNGGVPGVEAMLTGIYDDAFTDSAEIPDGGKQSLYWGYYNVLIREPEPDKIAPSGAVSRGDMAAMMVRYMDDFQTEPPEN